MPKQLMALPSGTKISILLQAEEANKNRKPQDVGFSLNLSAGDTILPKIVGSTTKKNSEGFDIVHRNQAKERRTFEIVSKRSQFCGRDQRETVEDYHTYTRMCYPKTFVPPLGIEITYYQSEDHNSYYASQVYKLGIDDEKIIAAINIFLELYEVCEVRNISEGGIPIVPMRKVNWELLPKGSEIRENSLEPVLRNLRSSAKRLVARRQFSSLHVYKPTSLAYGRGGFNGYVAFIYEYLGITVLESVEPNNATYIFNLDWEGVSQLSKGEIMQDELHLYRVIHSKHWINEIKIIMNRYKVAS